MHYCLRDTAIEIYKKWEDVGETFKEYIREELYCFAEGMLIAIKKDFKFVNITGRAHSELVYVTRTTVVSDYHPAARKITSMIQASPRFWGMTLLTYG